MDKSTYHSALANATSGKRMGFILLGLSVLANAAMAAALYNTAGRERTVLLPAQISRPMEFRGSDYSPQYLSEMATYFAGLVLTYHPDNLSHQAKTFLKHVHPNIYGALVTQMKLDAEGIKRRKWSSVFYPTEVRVKGQNVAVIGRLQTSVGSRMIEEKETVYVVEFDRLSTGQIAVSGFTEGSDIKFPFGRPADAG